MNDPDNPVEAHSKPPSQHSFLSANPLWRVAFFLVIGLIVAILLFYAEENLRGRWVWQKFKHAAEAKGEKLELTSMAPPPVPDDQNFALTPLLRPTFDYVHGSNGVHWRDTNAYAHLFTFILGSSAASREKPPPESASFEKNSGTDLEAWRDFFQDNPNFPQPPSPTNAAGAILIALGKFNPDLQELQTAATARPYSRFPVEYDQEFPSGILLPHLAFVKAISTVLALRAVANLELGRSEPAAADLKLGFRLSDCVSNEPILIDHLVRIAVLGIDLQVLREGLIRHAWTDGQLAEFEKYLASVDLLPEYQRAMRGERACAVGDLELMRRRGFKASDLSAPQEKDGNSSSAENIASSFSFMPGGWYYQNMLAISRMHQKYLLVVVDESQHRVFPEASDDFGRVLGRQRLNPYNVFAKLLLPALGGAVRRSARMQTFVEEARVACALERYRLANGQLPETLDPLVPRFIGKIPTDLFDGQPLRYRRNANGGYLIYSIGWNQIDDGGALVWRKGKSPSLDIDHGDWVWQ